MRRWRWFNFSLQINKYFLCSQKANKSLTNFPKRVLISCDSKGESRAVGTWEPIQGKPSPPVTWKEAVWGLLPSKPAFCLMLITKCKKVAGRSSIYEPADEGFFFWSSLTGRLIWNQKQCWLNLNYKLAAGLYGQREFDTTSKIDVAKKNL